MSHTKPHTTDPLDLNNQKVAIMAELGFHTRAIANATGFTEAQINARTSLFGIRRRDYRDGKNEASARVLVMAIGKEPSPRARFFQRDELRAMAGNYSEVREKVRKRLAERAKEKTRAAKGRKGKGARA
jgi:hypothetical protein